MAPSLVNAELRPLAGMPGHNPSLLRVEVDGEVLNHLLQLLQGGGLTPDHMSHCLGPEAEVQGVEVWAVGQPVVFSSPRDDLVPKLGGKEGKDLSSAMGAGAILLEPILAPCCPAPDGRPDHVLKHGKVGGSINTSLKPVDREDTAVHNANPGHDLGAMGFLALHNFVWVHWTPIHIILLVGSLVENKPLFVTPNDSLKLLCSEV